MISTDSNSTGAKMSTTEFFLLDLHGFYIPRKSVVKLFFNPCSIASELQHINRLGLSLIKDKNKELISTRSIAKAIDTLRAKQSPLKKEAKLKTSTSALLFQYDNFLIPLADVARDFLNCSLETARTKYNKGELHMAGLNAFRLGDQKSPIFVHVEDLSEFIDTKRKEAMRSINELCNKN